MTTTLPTPTRKDHPRIAVSGIDADQAFRIAALHEANMLDDVLDWGMAWYSLRQKFIDDMQIARDAISNGNR